MAQKQKKKQELKACLRITMFCLQMMAMFMRVFIG